MIPKRIYYTWISDQPLPKKFQKYLDSWRLAMPKYEIVQISKQSIARKEFGLSQFTKKAMAMKNYALAGHYERVQELYNNGGIYFDIDVEAVKSFDDLLNLRCFLGDEDNDVTNNAVIGAERKHLFLKACMDYLDSFDFSAEKIELETGPRMFTKLARGRDDLTIFSPEYFYPYHYTEKFDKSCIKPSTYAIHHWAHSWSKDVSIIIPCYKQAHWLADAIESALNQTLKPLEVIVVNDGSPDNASEVARRYPVKLVEQENRGLAGARNAGIKVAKGKWILTLDADDKIDPTFLEKTIGLDDIVGVGLQEFGEMSGYWLPPKMNPVYEDFIAHNQLNCCSLFKKEIWDTIGGYDEQMRGGYEDWEFWIRATKAGFTVTTIKDPLFYYRKHGKSMIDEAKERHDELYKYILNKQNAIQ